MFFNIRYRSKDGRISHLEIEAENKAALWPELKRLGINAISISEGKVPAKKKGGSASSQSRGMNLLKYALIIIPIIAVGLYFFINPKMSEQNTDKLIKSVENKDTIKVKKAKAVTTALQGFKDGLYRAFLDETELVDLDAPLMIRENDTITFIRLTMLTGSIW